MTRKGSSPDTPPPLLKLDATSNLPGGGSETVGETSSANWVLPETPHLMRGLEEVFPDEVPVAVVGREPNAYAAYYPSEIVACRFREGRTRQLLVKYSANPDEMQGGRLTGPKYERLVYEHVLNGRQSSVPAFYGCHVDLTSGAMWSVTEYLAGAVQAHKMYPQAHGLGRAAAWIGAFHASGERELRVDDAPPLHRHDAQFYRRWAEWTLEYEGNRQPWLRQLVRRYDEVIDHLLAQPQVVVHGDYFADNVLLHGDTVSPVDWELAAVGTGEVDLAALIVGWETEQDVLDRCRFEYEMARWGESPQPQLARVLDGAMLHVLFVLLGEDPSIPNRETRRWRLDLLKAAGQRVGLI